MKKFRVFQILTVLAIAISLSAPGGMAQAAPVNLLQNASFDTDANRNDLPDGWKARSLDLTVDGLDSANAKNGFAMKMQGKPMVKKQLSQTIFFDGSEGDEFRFSAWAAGENIPGVAFFRARVQFYDGTTLVDYLSISFLHGTHAYEEYFSTITLTQPFDRIVVNLSYKAGKGTAWFDETNLEYLGNTAP
jgi:hypothetical protein